MAIKIMVKNAIALRELDKYCDFTFKIYSVYICRHLARRWQYFQTEKRGAIIKISFSFNIKNY